MGTEVAWDTQVGKDLQSKRLWVANKLQPELQRVYIIVYTMCRTACALIFLGTYYMLYNQFL
jgi:hypothetical protein